MEPWIVRELIIPLAGMATGIFISLGLFRTIRLYLERKGGGSPDPELQRTVADIRERLESMDVGRERLDDIEDRLDFAERMLARERDARALGEG